MGDRLQQTYNSATTTNYTIDIAGGLTQVLSDGTNTYLYGVNRISQQHDTTTEYYLADALGSVRQLTNSGGEVVLARAYDPYGNLVENNAYDGVTTAYGYAGEYTDDASGMVYLRARYYSPTQGRFVSRDPSGLEENLYLYANANLINYTDPSGMISCTNNADPDCLISIDLVKQYADSIKVQVKNGVLLPIEGFANTVDFAYWLFGKDYRGMSWALTNIINGFDPNSGDVWKQVFIKKSNLSEFYVHEDWLPYKNNPDNNDDDWGAGEYGTWVHSIRGDWKKEYWDKTANQAYHFWFYVAVAFFDGKGWAELANIVHDNPSGQENYDYINSPEDESPPKSGNSEPDYQLAKKGIELGSQMNEEYQNWYQLLNFCPGMTLPPLPPLSFNPGSWIRVNLK